MFTGIVRTIGSVMRLEPRGGDLRLTIDAPGFDWPAQKIGDSVCVNGVCLTAVKLHPGGFETDISRETMRVTALAGLTRGDKVNIEPALALGERLGGHLVSGHVDGVGEVRTLAKDARSFRLGIEIPVEFARYVARKGSVCVDGVSLTINAVSANGIELNIIPHTAESTIIGGYEVGTQVNIEVDVLARYIERLLSKGDGDGR
jgi:riboflavin synthase